MLGMLEGTEEYNNQGALLGLDGAEGEELLGALRRMNPIQRQKWVNKLSHPGAMSKGSRAEMEKHFAELPAHIRQGLAKGELRLADTVIYSIKPVTSKTIKMFETQDDKEIGLRNVSNAKLPNNQALLVSGIVLLAATAADATKDKVIAANFDKIESFPAIANGEFSLKSNNLGKPLRVGLSATSPHFAALRCGLFASIPFAWQCLIHKFNAFLINNYLIK